MLHLTLSWRRPLSYRNQSIDLRSKSVDWFLYDNGLHHERVNTLTATNLCMTKAKLQEIIKNIFFSKKFSSRLEWTFSFTIGNICHCHIYFLDKVQRTGNELCIELTKLKKGVCQKLILNSVFLVWYYWLGGYTSVIVDKAVDWVWEPILATRIALTYRSKK